MHVCNPYIHRGKFWCACPLQFCTQGCAVSLINTSLWCVHIITYFINTSEWAGSPPSKVRCQRVAVERPLSKERRSTEVCQRRASLLLQCYLYIYLRIFVCLFVCLFAVNAKTTERIDFKRSGITKNYPESVLCGLKSPVLVLLGRYGYISGFSFAADRHFYLSSFHFRLLLRRLTQGASQTQQNYGTNWRQTLWNYN